MSIRLLVRAWFLDVPPEEEDAVVAGVESTWAQASALSDAATLGWFRRPLVAHVDARERSDDRDLSLLDRRLDSIAKLLAVGARNPQRIEIEAWTAWQGKDMDESNPERRLVIDERNFPSRVPQPLIDFAPGGWGAELLRLILPDRRRGGTPTLADPVVDRRARSVVAGLAFRHDVTRCGYCGRGAGDPDDRGDDGLPGASSSPTRLLRDYVGTVCKRCAVIVAARVPRPAGLADRSRIGVVLTDGNPPLVPFLHGFECSNCCSICTTGDALLVAAEVNEFALCSWCLHGAADESKGWGSGWAPA